MTQKYRLFRRQSGVYYIQDNETGRQQSLRTKNKQEAETLFNANKEAYRQPYLNLQLARTYLMGTDSKMVTRTWQEVMDKIVSLKKGATRDRWDRAIQDRAYEGIRTIPLIETRADHFLRVLETGRISTNVYLRRIHNFALAMDWLLKPIVPRREWPKVIYRKKKAITWDEHQKIIAREGNPERRDLYELCWHLGGSQSDIANLLAEDVDWSDSTIGYQRCKLKNRPTSRTKSAIIRFGEEVAEILRRRPQSGPLFPYLLTIDAKYRATEFGQRCHGLGIEGVTLHSYRYAWAERARKCGFPLRFAQEALGHNSKAVHEAYASKAEVTVPSLEAWEKGMKDKLIEFKPVVLTPIETPTASAPIAAAS